MVDTVNTRESIAQEPLGGRLVEATLHMLRTAPVDQLSLRRVAEQVGVSHQAPYVHFGSKRRFLAASGFGLGAHLVATNVLAARGHLIPGWLVAVGLVSAVAFLLAAVLGAVTTDAASTIVSLVGFVLWLCWILGVSYRMATTGPGSRGAAGSATTEVPVAGARGRQP